MAMMRRLREGEIILIKAPSGHLTQIDIVRNKDRHLCAMIHCPDSQIQHVKRDGAYGESFGAHKPEIPDFDATANCVNPLRSRLSRRR